MYYLCITNKPKTKAMKAQIETVIKGYESAKVSQDEESYYIDLNTGLGESIYPKGSFSFEEAIEDAINMKIE